jgi:hypothetical protein
MMMQMTSYTKGCLRSNPKSVESGHYRYRPKELQLFFSFFFSISRDNLIQMSKGGQIAVQVFRGKT